MNGIVWIFRTVVSIENIVGCKRVSIMKSDTLPELENIIGTSSSHLPTLGEITTGDKIGIDMR